MSRRRSTHPRARRFGAFLLSLTVALGLSAVATATASAANPWVKMHYPEALNPGTMLLLTNGTVLVEDQGIQNDGSRNWWLLTPTAKGNYVDGTWRKVASLQPGYGPIDYASAVLPDGRVIIEGGEDNLNHNQAFTNQGSIYDPVANKWTPVAPPTGSAWDTVGDAPGTVLADGTFMMGGAGNYTNGSQALFNPTTLTWTATGANRVDYNEESGFTLLPNDDVLSVGVFPTANLVEMFNPTTGMWTSDGTTPVGVVDTAAGEIGSQPLMPNGDVLVLGGLGPNALYSTSTGTWSAAPSLPVIAGKQFNVDDGPAAVLPDGNVLIDASPGAYKPPEQFFLYNAVTDKISTIINPPFARQDHSDFGRMLVLPNGQVLFTDRYLVMAMYTAGGKPQATWRPVITQMPTALAPGGSYTFSGTQLNGLTQGAYYGDDNQDATNYPLVRLTYPTGRVVYARTSGMTSMSVTPGLASSANFALPKVLPAGTASLQVVANGIPSLPVKVTVS